MPLRAWRKVRAEFEEALTSPPAHQASRLHQLPNYWAPYKRGRYRADLEVDTGMDAAALAEMAAGLTRYPADFAIHPKVKRLLEQRLGNGPRHAPCRLRHG